jgi:hypothetical protein
LIEAVVERGRSLKLPPFGSRTDYRAFIDPSGGVGGDSYNIARAARPQQIALDRTRDNSSSLPSQFMRQRIAYPLALERPRIGRYSNLSKKEPGSARAC